MENRVLDIIVEVCDNEMIRKNMDIDLLENDMIDSLAFITLIERLEEEFDIEIQPTQETPDTWRNVESIVELVKRCTDGK